MNLKFYVRNPNYPLQVEQVLNTEKEARRFKMVTWEPFDNKKRYLELGERNKTNQNICLTTLSIVRCEAADEG